MGVLPEVEENENERKAFKSEFVAQTHHLKKRMDREASGQRTFFSNNGLLIIIILILFAIFFFWFITVTIRHLFYARHHTSSSRLHR